MIIRVYTKTIFATNARMNGIKLELPLNNFLLNIEVSNHLIINSL